MELCGDQKKKGKEQEEAKYLSYNQVISHQISLFLSPLSLALYRTACNECLTLLPAVDFDASMSVKGSAEIVRHLKYCSGKDDDDGE